MLTPIIRKINMALLENSFEIDNSLDVTSKYYLCGYKMALNDIGSWIEKEIIDESHR